MHQEGRNLAQKVFSCKKTVVSKEISKHVNNLNKYLLKSNNDDQLGGFKK